MSSVQEIRQSECAASAARHHQAENDQVNVGDTERLVSQLGGAVLLGAGLLRGGAKGLLLATLGGALIHRGVTGRCMVYQLLGANTADVGRGPADSVPARSGFRVEEAITIDRSPEELFQFWRDPMNLPQIMAEIESAETRSGNRIHWVARGPLGMRVEWEEELYNERPNEMIAWRSLDGGDVETAGSVHLTRAPGNRGTEVRVNLKINPPGGKLGVAVAKLFGADPARRTRDSLRRLKQLMEAGEFATTEGQPRGPA